SAAAGKGDLAGEIPRDVGHGIPPWRQIAAGCPWCPEARLRRQCLKAVTQLLLREARGLRRGDEVRDRPGEALWRLTVGKVSDVLEDLEPAPRDRRVGTTGMIHRDDRVARAPHDERREVGGELQPVVGADSLPVEADNGAKRAEERRTAVGVDQRAVAPTDLLAGRSRAEADSTSPPHEGTGGIVQRRSTEEPEDVSGAGKRQRPQQEVDLASEAAAADQHEALAQLRELVGELHRDAAAERVADDGRLLVAEHQQEVPEERRVRAERVIAGRLRRLPVAEKIRSDD